MNEKLLRQLFKEMFDKLDSASSVREWENAARGNTYAESEASRQKYMANLKKRFEEAMGDA